DAYAGILAKSGRSADVVSLWEQQARCRADAGDGVEAAALWARAAELAEVRVGDAARAIEDHGRGAALGGVASLEALARIHTAAREDAKAAEVLERLLTLTPEGAAGGADPRAAVALRLAEAYVRAGAPAEARARLERFPNDAAARSRLAELYAEAELWDPLAALAADEAARAAAPEQRVDHLRRAVDLHLWKRRDPAASVPLLERAVALAPDDATLGLALGEALYAIGRFDDSVRALEAQVERYGARKPKDRALTHYALARAAVAAGDKARALEELDAAARIDRAHAGVLHALGRLAFELGDLPRAARAFQALLLRPHADEGAVQRSYQALVDLHRKDGEAKDGDVSRVELLLDLADIAELEGDAVRAAEFRGSALDASRASPEDEARYARALATRGGKA
ncbi:MAG TPA: tetratricopeptide repeat protein, partial [Byssovorax sp.]